MTDAIQHAPGLAASDEVAIRQAKILYASLPDQVERRKAIQRNVQDTVPIAFVESIDGRQWTEEEAFAHVSEYWKDRRTRLLSKGVNSMPTGAVACALTHRDRLLANAEEGGKILCEDDAMFDTRFLEHVASNEVAEVLERLSGVTLLNYRWRGDIQAEREPVAYIGKYSVHRLRSKSIVSAAAYYLPARLVGPLRAAQTPVDRAADLWTEFRDNGVFEDVFLVHPTPARVGQFISSINYGLERNSVFMEWLRRNNIIRRLRWHILEYRGMSSQRITGWVE